MQISSICVKTILWAKLWYDFSSYSKSFWKTSCFFQKVNFPELLVEVNNEKTAEPRPHPSPMRGLGLGMKLTSYNSTRQAVMALEIYQDLKFAIYDHRSVCGTTCAHIHTWIYIQTSPHSTHRCWARSGSPQLHVITILK